MQPNQITADLAKESDIDRILEIGTLEYGPGYIMATPADFHWRYNQNPAGLAIIPVIRDEAGSVIGLIWIVPIQVRIRGQDHRAATGIGLVVDPKHRDTFGYARLIRSFDKVFIDNRIPLHFSFPTERRFQRQLKKEPRWCGTIPLLAKVLDFDALARIYLTREWQSTLVSWPGRWVSRLVFSQAQMAPGEEIRVETSAQFTPEFDRFWREVCDKYPAMTIRDRAYLAWRYAPSPRRRFHILVARAQGRMVGYAVLGSKKLRGVKTGLIMELMVAEGASGEQAGSHLLAEAEDFFRAQKMAVIAGLMAPFADEYRILRRAGYRPVPEALAPRVFRFIFMLHETRDSDLLSLSVGDWYVTLSDYESF